MLSQENDHIEYDAKDLTVIFANRNMFIEVCLCIHALVSWVIIASGKGLSSAWCWAFI